MINQVYDNVGLENTQMIAAIFDRIRRNSPMGVNFKSVQAKWAGSDLCVSAILERMTGHKTDYLILLGKLNNS